MEPCLNGTLVRADKTNKDVSFARQSEGMNPHRSMLQNQLCSSSAQHFREHLDKLFAKGIGLLGEALAEAFTILSDVSSSTSERAQLRHCPFFFFHGVISFIYSVVRDKET